VKAMISGAPSPLRAVVLDAEGQDDLDLTSADVLKRLVADLRDGDMAVYFADVHAPVLERARETGLLEAVGDRHVFPTVDLAVRAIEGDVDPPAAPGGGDRAGRQP